MALPKIKQPTFRVTIPSTNKKTMLRPFTVKEEKLLLMAKEADSEGTIIDTILQVVRNCVLDDEIDVDTLASFDIEYLMVKLRAKSVSETIDLKINVSDTESVEYTLNLDEVEVKINPDHTRKFMLTDEVGFIMRYPTLAMLRDTDSSTEVEEFFNRICDCVEVVYDSDNVYDDFSKEEIRELVSNLPSSAVKRLRDFFTTMPKLEHDIVVTNKEGEEIKRTLRGLSDFFTL